MANQQHTQRASRSTTVQYVEASQRLRLLARTNAGIAQEVAAAGGQADLLATIMKREGLLAPSWGLAASD